VVVPGNDEIAALSRWNQCALDVGQPWLLTLPFDGRFAAVGPLFLPGDTCCYECFRLRRLAGLDYDDEFWALERSAPPSRSAAARPCSAPTRSCTSAALIPSRARLSPPPLGRRPSAIPPFTSPRMSSSPPRRGSWAPRRWIPQCLHSFTSASTRSRDFHSSRSGRTPSFTGCAGGRSSTARPPSSPLSSCTCAARPRPNLR